MKMSLLFTDLRVIEDVDEFDSTAKDILEKRFRIFRQAASK